jgi:hypothetical protein
MLLHNVTIEEAYITHVGNVLCLLVRDKDLVPQSLASPNLVSPEFIDGTTSQYIQKVDESLQQVIQRCSGWIRNWPVIRHDTRSTQHVHKGVIPSAAARV